MLFTGKYLLDVANENNFAIPAFNISDWAMFNGVMDISEEKPRPGHHRDPPRRGEPHQRRPHPRDASPARTARACRSRSTGTTAAPTSR